MDITSLTFILSILITILLSTDLIERKVNKVVEVVKLVSKYADKDKEIRRLLEDSVNNETKARKVDIESIEEKYEFRISSLEMTLRCNITILFWSTFFYLLLILFAQTGVYELSSNQIFLSVLFVTMLPYVYRLMWYLLRRKTKSGKKINKKIENKNLFTRYPFAYMWGVISFQGMLLVTESKNSLYQYYSNNIVVALFLTFSVLLAVYFLARIFTALNRAYTVVHFSKGKLKEELEEIYLFTDVSVEKWSFIMSFLFASIFSYIGTEALIYAEKTEKNVVASGLELTGYANVILIAIVVVTIAKVLLTMDRSSFSTYLQKCYREDL